MPTPIRFKGIVGTTAQIATDRFAGRIAFDSTLARFVVFFDATNYAINARRDVLETFAAGIRDSTLTSGRVVMSTTSGRLTGDAGLTFGQESGVTRLLTLGDGAVASALVFQMSAGAGQTNGTTLLKGGVGYWRYGMTLSGSDAYRISNYAGSTLIDHAIVVADGSAATITIGGTTLRTTNFTGAIQTSGVTRISSGGAGTLTTLSTTGLATLAQATVSDLTTGRMVSTTTAGRLQTLNYVPLGNTALGAGEPRLCSGVASGNLLLLSGLDVTDTPGSFSYLQLGGGGAATALGTSGALTLGSSNGGTTIYTGTGLSGGIVRIQSNTTDAISGNAYNQYTTVTQTGIVTNQSLAGTGRGSRTIGAGRLNLEGSGLELYLCGTYTTDASPGNATIRIRIGSTTFRTIGSFALDSSITSGIWYIRGQITTRTTGATGTVGGQLMWEHQASSVVGSQVLHIEPSTSTADVTVDLTASQTIDVDWTATDAGTSITCTCFSINLIR